jgi:hypothetical protein
MELYFGMNLHSGSKQGSDWDRTIIEKKNIPIVEKRRRTLS